MNTDVEIWKPIDGLDGMYEVSCNGCVRSVDRTVQSVNGPRNYRGKVLRQYIGKKNGYYYTRIREKGMLALVHRLVAKAFVPNPESVDTVDHVDGNKTNNHHQNLRWVTRGQNTGLFWKGIRRDIGPSFCMKLDESSVRKIRQLKEEMSGNELAKIYNVSKSTILRAANKQTWAYLQ